MIYDPYYKLTHVRVKPVQDKKQIYILEIPPKEGKPMAVKITHNDFGIVTTPVEEQGDEIPGEPHTIVRNWF